MTISIENKADSGIALLQHTGTGSESVLVPFAFPSQRVDIVPEHPRYTYFTRVPMIEISSDAVIPIGEAREAIPEIEAVGKELEGYIVESLQKGLGGKVNGMTLDVGVNVDDQGILFIAS